MKLTCVVGGLVGDWVTGGDVFFASFLPVLSLMVLLVSCCMPLSLRLKILPEAAGEPQHCSSEVQAICASLEHTPGLTGDLVGLREGDDVGDLLGLSVGFLLGLEVGLLVTGFLEGLPVGLEVGSLLGLSVGPGVGAGSLWGELGLAVGLEVGFFEGSGVGCIIYIK